MRVTWKYFRIFQKSQSKLSSHMKNTFPFPKKKIFFSLGNNKKESLNRILFHLIKKKHKVFFLISRFGTQKVVSFGVGSTENCGKRNVIF